MIGWPRRSQVIEDPERILSNFGLAFDLNFGLVFQHPRSLASFLSWERLPAVELAEEFKQLN